MDPNLEPLNHAFSAIMPGFQHSVAFCRSVLPLRSVAVARENRIAGNVFPYTCMYRDEVTRTPIGCPPTAERQRNGGNQA